MELRLAIGDRERGALAAGNVPMVGGASDQLLDVPGALVPVVVADPRWYLMPVLGDARVRDRCGHHRQDRGDGERGHGVAAQRRKICHNGFTPAVTRSWLLRLLRPDGYGLRRSRSTRGRSWVPASPPVVGGLCVTYRSHPNDPPCSSCTQASANRPGKVEAHSRAGEGTDDRPSRTGQP